MTSDTATAPTTHEGVRRFVEWAAELCQPDAIHWVTGSIEERDQLNQLLVDGGTFTRLDDAKKPDSFHCASDPSDVARVE
ncbi:MAG: phosphoenolpyruvate carboxykinase, partial [Nocardioidaceae bacterium]